MSREIEAVETAASETPHLPMLLYGVWCPALLDGNPGWLQHIDGGDGPVVYEKRSDAEEEAEEYGGRVVAIMPRIVFES